MKNLAYLSIIMSPLLSNYVFFAAVSFGDVSILFSLLLILIIGAGQSKAITKLMPVAIAVAFFAYSLSILLVFWEGALNGGFYRLFFYCSLLFLLPLVNWSQYTFLKLAEVVGNLLSISLLVQFLVYVLGYTLIFRLPIEQYEIDALEIVDHIYRGGGWFREPSYFALYLLPVIVYQARGRRWYGFLLSASALVVSTSSLAFMAFAAIVLDQFLLRGVKASSLMIFTATAGIIGSLLAFFQDLTFVSRILDIGSGGGSFAIRVLPFFDYMDQVIVFYPPAHNTNPILQLTEYGEVWFSSVFYMVALFGINIFLFLVPGLLYMRSFFGILFFILLFTTSIASSAFSFYIAVAFYCLINFSYPSVSVARIDRLRDEVAHSHSL